MSSIPQLTRSNIKSLDKAGAELFRNKMRLSDLKSARVTYIKDTKTIKM